MTEPTTVTQQLSSYVIKKLIYGQYGDIRPGHSDLYLHNTWHMHLDACMADSKSKFNNFILIFSLIFIFIYFKCSLTWNTEIIELYKINFTELYG